ncbi:hypothetical protein [Alkaliphilus transvaalensis]|uniref:hypothetical protein n=1 Tax=Alkaliphilus transvaalensis TaxID=114628 RepID=UPI00047C0FA0|nr:hypothetical protein [Alkaliphilus transvaalensis]
MERVIDQWNYVQQDVSYQVVKLAKDKIKVTVQWNSTPTKGHKIKIQDVIVIENKIKVVYKKIYPNGDSINCQVITNSTDSWEGSVDGIYEDYTVTLSDKTN